MKYFLVLILIGFSGFFVSSDIFAEESKRCSFGNKIILNYTISDNEMVKMCHDVGASSIIMYVEPKSDGFLTVDVPRKAVNPIITCEKDDVFYVLFNGEEVSYEEIKTTEKFRRLVIPFPNGIHEIEIIGTFVTQMPEPFPSCTYLYENDRLNITPLKQTALGIKSLDVLCETNLFLVQKYDGSPACVKLETKIKLVEREWGNKTILVQNSDFAISYSVTKGELINAMANLDTQSLVLDVQMTDDGNMTLKLPRGLIDSVNNGKDEVFTVLVEGKKVEHDEQNTQNRRILNFSLLSSETGSVTVEIIPYCPSWKCD